MTRGIFHDDGEPMGRVEAYLKHCDRTDGPLTRPRRGFRPPRPLHPDVDELETEWLAMEHERNDR